MKALVIAPHPDDETIGCGGTLLRRRAEGGETAWLICTAMTEAGGWSAADIARRAGEIETVAGRYGFARVFQPGFPTTGLDAQPARALIEALAAAFAEFAPDEVLVPHGADVHSDHRRVFEAATACVKWFRAPSVKRVLAYETLSETDAALDPDTGFGANVFVDITAHLDAKLEILDLYASELGAFPFPRSARAVRALAEVRGAAAGFAAAEAFQLLRERQ